MEYMLWTMPSVLFRCPVAIGISMWKPPAKWGYDPGSKKDFNSEFTNQTGFVYVPPGDYNQRTILGDKDMAGLILQNRIVENQKLNRYDLALSLAADRLVLTGSDLAQKDYFDSLQNMAAWYNRMKEYGKGDRHYSSRRPKGLMSCLIFLTGPVIRWFTISAVPF